MITTVCRKESFNAAHRLHNPDWTAEENTNFFGLCNNPSFHGHNYDLIVKVTGEVDKASGYLIDMKYLSEIVHEEVISQFDHKNLNLDTKEFATLNPTAENIAFVIYHKLKNRLDKQYTLSIVLYETPRNYVEYNGQ